MFYHKLSGEPPPNVAHRLNDLVAFFALAAASGIVGNLAYDVLKALVLHLAGDDLPDKFEAKITAELYENVRSTVHVEAGKTDDQTLSTVRRDVELKYRLIVEKGHRR